MSETREYSEILERIYEVVTRGQWAIVEEYLKYEITNKTEELIIEKDIERIRTLQGEISAYRKMLQLREDALSYIASEDPSEPGD